LNNIKLRDLRFLIKDKDITDIKPVAFDLLEKDSVLWIGNKNQYYVQGCAIGKIPNYKVKSIKIKDLVVYVKCIKIKKEVV
jgi:hypothetical protein